MRSNKTESKSLRYFWTLPLYAKVKYNGEVYIKVSSKEIMNEAGHRVTLLASAELEVVA